MANVNNNGSGQARLDTIQALRNSENLTPNGTPDIGSRAHTAVDAFGKGLSKLPSKFQSTAAFRNPYANPVRQTELEVDGILATVSGHIERIEENIGEQAPALLAAVYNQLVG